MELQGPIFVLQWSPPLRSPLLPFSSSLRAIRSSSVPAASAPSALEASNGGELTGRERRQLRREGRVSSRAGSWREEVEERLLHKPKKRFASWTEELNLDNLALPGPQWWVVRVSRVNGRDAADRLVRSLIRNFPTMDFKVYFPTVREKRKLNNGSYTEKSKPFFPGCVFLHCILNREVHDFIRDCDGIGGFLGSRVGNTKRQINRPRPVPVDEIEKIFKEVKEEQEKFDQAFEEEQQKLNTILSVDSADNVKSTADDKPKRHLRKGLEPSKRTPVTTQYYKSLVPGTTVRVLSGPFTEYTGRVNELNRKTGKAIVGFMLFGKESFVDLEIDQIAAVPT